MEGKSTISSLIFSNYIVNKVNYLVNNKQGKKEESVLNFDITSIINVNKEKNKMNVVLGVDVFKGVENAPFYMNVEIEGFFKLDNEDDITKYEANAIAIMYPYLRAIVSTYTSSANVAPIILPAINVNAMLKKKKEDKKIKDSE